MATEAASAPPSKGSSTAREKSGVAMSLGKGTHDMGKRRRAVRGALETALCDKSSARRIEQALFRAARKTTVGEEYVDASRRILAHLKHMTRGDKRCQKVRSGKTTAKKLLRRCVPDLRLYRATQKDEDDRRDALARHRFALTWGDCGENHVGNQLVGKKQETGTGVTIADLRILKAMLEKEWLLRCELMVFAVPPGCPHEDEAGVLIVREFLSEPEQKEVHSELNAKPWDAKFYDKRKKKVLNKWARENLIFQRGVSQDAVYEEGKGTICDMNKMVHLSKVDEKIRQISAMIAQFSTTSTRDCPLICEGNRYRTQATTLAKQQGIRHHGDTERTRVFAASIGGYNYPMQWVLFKNSLPQMEPEKVRLNSGDVYIMSELAVGQQWNKKSQWTWRHAAGHPKYLSLDKYKNKRRR